MTSRTRVRSSVSGGAGPADSGGHPTTVPVRDSKNPEGPKLVFGAGSWAALVDGVKAP